MNEFRQNMYLQFKKAFNQRFHPTSTYTLESESPTCNNFLNLFNLLKKGKGRGLKLCKLLTLMFL